MLIEGIIISSYAIGANVAYIYIRGEFVDEAVDPRRRRSTRPRAAGFLGKNILGSGFDLDDPRPPRRRRLHLRRGDRADRVARGQAGPSPGSSRRSRRWSASSAARPSSTTSRPWPACPTSSSAAPSGSPVDRHRSGAPGRSCSPSPATSSGPGVYEVPLGIPFREIIDEHLRRHAGRQAAQGLHPGRLVVPGAAGGQGRHRVPTSSRWRRPARCSAPAG